MKDWNGKWWAESLEGAEEQRYAALVAKLRPEDAHVAREIFQLGHEHGYGLCSELSRED